MLLILVLLLSIIVNARYFGVGELVGKFYVEADDIADIKYLGEVKLLNGNVKEAIIAIGSEYTPEPDEMDVNFLVFNKYGRV